MLEGDFNVLKVLPSKNENTMVIEVSSGDRLLRH